jgi:PAS domain S-box-containing protein
MTIGRELASRPDIGASASAEERYRALVRATSSLVWTSAPDGQIADMPEWRAYTGMSVEHIKGWGWLESLHADDGERTTINWQRAIDTRSFYETEYRIRRVDGVYVWHQARGIRSSKPIAPFANGSGYARTSSCARTPMPSALKPKRRFVGSAACKRRCSASSLKGSARDLRAIARWFKIIKLRGAKTSGSPPITGGVR